VRLKEKIREKKKKEKKEKAKKNTSQVGLDLRQRLEVRSLATR